MVLKRRYKLIIMAIAMETSAAAIVIMNSVKKTPSIWLGKRYLLKATKLMLTLFRISSTDISIVIRFLLEKNPNTPRKNSVELKIKTCSKGTCSICSDLRNSSVI